MLCYVCSELSVCLIVQVIAGKTLPQNDLSCVERDVNLDSLTHSFIVSYTACAGLSNTTAVSLYRYSYQSRSARWRWWWRRTRRRLFVPSYARCALLPHIRRRCLDWAGSIAESTRGHSSRSFPRSASSKTSVSYVTIHDTITHCVTYVNNNISAL